MIVVQRSLPEKFSEVKTKTPRKDKVEVLTNFFTGKLPLIPVNSENLVHLVHFSKFGHKLWNFCGMTERKLPIYESGSDFEFFLGVIFENCRFLEDIEEKTTQEKRNLGKLGHFHSAMIGIHNARNCNALTKFTQIIQPGISWMTKPSPDLWVDAVISKGSWQVREECYKTLADLEW